MSLKGKIATNWDTLREVIIMKREMAVPWRRVAGVLVVNRRTLYFEDCFS